jgi:periplasmic copper chaperone A
MPRATDQSVSCDAFVQLLSADLDGELVPAEEATLQAHLATCDGCRGLGTRLGAHHRAWRVRAAEPVPDQTDAILAAAAPPLRRRRGVGLVAAAAASVALLGLGAVVVANRSPAAAPELSLVDARASTARAGGTASVYFYLANDGGSDELLAVTSPDAADVRLHRVDDLDGVPVMRTVATLPVPGDGATDLRPGGTHVMLVGLAQDAAPGDVLDLTLHLARSGELQVRAVVESDEMLLS